MKLRNIFGALVVPVIVGVAICGCGRRGGRAVEDVSIARYRGDKAAAISFTYDDGTLCHYTEVAPELEKRGFRGTFWIVGNDIGRQGDAIPFMTWEQVAELSARGHEVSNHSWSHPDLTKLSDEDLHTEIFRCDSAIYAATGKRPTTFCYPYNAMNARVVEVAGAGRVGTRTFWEPQGQEESHCTDESLAQWLDSTIVNNAWAVTMSHSTTYGWDKWEDPEVLWRLYDRVKEREGDVWVAPFAEVAAYVAERDNITLIVDTHKDGISITPKTNLDTMLFTEPLTLKITGDFSGNAVTAEQDGEALEVTPGEGCLLMDFLPGKGEIRVIFE